MADSSSMADQILTALFRCLERFGKLVPISLQSVLDPVVGRNALVETLSDRPLESSSTHLRDTADAIRAGVWLTVLDDRMRCSAAALGRVARHSDVETADRISTEFIEATFESLFLREDACFSHLASSPAPGVYNYSLLLAIEVLNNCQSRLMGTDRFRLSVLFKRVVDKWSSVFHESLRGRTIYSELTSSSERCISQLEKYCFSIHDQQELFELSPIQGDESIDDDVFRTMTKSQALLLDSLQVELNMKGLQTLPFYRPRVEKNNIEWSFPLASVLNQYYQFNPLSTNPWLEHGAIKLFNPVSHCLLEAVKSIIGPIYWNQNGDYWILNTNLQIMFRQWSQLIMTYSHYVCSGVLPTIQNAFETQGQQDRQISFKLLDILVIWSNDIRTLKENIFNLDSGLWAPLRNNKFIDLCGGRPEGNFIDVLRSYWPSLTVDALPYLEKALDDLLPIARSIENNLVYQKILSSIKVIATLLTFHESQDEKTASRYVTDMSTYYLELSKCLTSSPEATKFIQKSLSDLLDTIAPKLNRQLAMIASRRLLQDKFDTDFLAISAMVDKLQSQLSSQDNDAQEDALDSGWKSVHEKVKCLSEN
eukprot:GHVH01011038.1.p1 GENE.GHVH01011038.1~~GHVH01011038.1.p1  ORF type:complete len:594 (+),score=74.77 GHVH01011038.1:674-2455(+)